MQNLNGLYVTLTLVAVVFAVSHDAYATYGYDQNSNQNTVTNIQQVSDTTNSNNIQVVDSNISVQYSISNGQVTSINGNNESRSVIVHMKTTDNGILSITLPRGLIDSLTNGKDDKFFVVIDGQEEPFDETKTTSNDRTLSIPFSAGVQEIEIIGTKAVPEFGIITSLTLVIATASVIVLVPKIRKTV
jgi:hypothetical protein